MVSKIGFDFQGPEWNERGQGVYCVERKWVGARERVVSSLEGAFFSAP